MKGLFILLAFVCGAQCYLPVENACFCIKEFPSECAFMSGMLDKKTFVTKISDGTAALYWMDKVAIESKNMCQGAEKTKRFIDLVTGPNYGVGLGYENGMGVIKAHYDFNDHVSLHGYGGGNPFTGNYGGGIGVTIKFGRK